MAKWLKWVGLLVLVVGLAWGSGGSRVYAQNITQSVGNYVVHQGQTITGNVDVNVGNIVVNGTVDGNVNVGVGNVEVSGLIKGSVHVGIGKIQVLNSGRIDGTRSVDIGNATASNVGIANHWMHWTSIISSAHVNGLAFPFIAGWGWTSRFLSKLVINLVVSAVLVLLFPQLIRRIVSGMEEAPLRAAAVGCLTLVAWVVAMFGLAVIIIGIPITILLGLAGAVAILIANGAVVWLVGARVVRAAGSSAEMPEWYVILLAGGALVTLAEMIPGIGWLAELAVMVLGVGAMVQSRFGFGGPRWPEDPNK